MNFNEMNVWCRGSGERGTHGAARDGEGDQRAGQNERRSARAAAAEGLRVVPGSKLAAAIFWQGPLREPERDPYPPLAAVVCGCRGTRAHARCSSLTRLRWQEA
jgi:hypothetical protein